MMSLFSSFDLKIFNMTFITLTLIISKMMSELFFKSSFISMKKLFVSIMSKFLNSIKPNMFTKTTKNLLMSLFLTWMILNFTSILPFNFPMTSQISVVLSVSLIFWFAMMLMSTTKNFKSVITHFVPQGAPMALTPFLFLIEMVSILIRPITITVRLVANILAGHLLMSLLSSLIMKNFSLVFLYAMLNLIEMFVAVIQAYIFCTMMTLYYQEV